MDEPKIEGRLTDAVELVSHETRARILVVLADRQREAPGEPLRFSELRRRVGHDDPGNFNYHLDRLAGRLVDTVDGRYRLSIVGQRFVATLLSGRFDPDADPDLPAGGVDCPICARPATVSSEDATLRLDCEVGHTFVPNVGAEVAAGRSAEDALRIALARTRTEMRLAIDGVCPFCEGKMTGGLEVEPNDDIPAGFVATCKRCGLGIQNTVGGCVLDHPAVVALCYEHGIDVREDALTVLTDHVEEPVLLDEEQPRVEVTVSVDGEAVTLVLDENGEVRESPE